MQKNRTFLKWISLPLIATFVFAQSAYAQTESFTDLESQDPSGEGIEFLKEHGVIHGYPDGTFKSTNKINRAEFMKIVVGSLEEFDPNTEDGANCFTDVKDEWFAKYVCYGKDHGIVSGYADGSFRPANNINFAEASKIVVNAFGIRPTETENIDPWYRTFVEPLADKKAIPESISDLDKFIARGEMAEVIYRVKDNETEKESLKYHDLEGVPMSGQSCEALYDFFEEAQGRNYYYNDLEEDAIAVPLAAESMAADDSASPSSTAARSQAEGKGGSGDFSSTNVQVQGVDEADIVKNDGEYIYQVSNSMIRIIKAYPADQMEEVAQVEIEDENFNPSQIYVYGDTMAVIGNVWSYQPYEMGAHDIAIPRMWYPNFHTNRTMVALYNISDRANPRMTRKLTFDGNASHSRRVGDTMYLVLNKYTYTHHSMPEEMQGEMLLPRFSDSVEASEEQFLADCEDIMYFPRTRDLNYVIAVAVPLMTNDDITSEVMLGNSENIYASADNLYIAATNYDSGHYYHDWNNAKTVVYRYSLTPGKIKYEARGKVPGTILNQFSMDEHEGFFRIATTKGNFWGSGENVSTNNLYTLNLTDMNVAGEIENIAPGERIYSTRFMGDRGYMVTFKKVDPLFAFDLSDPYNPTILGKLKIPGYSDYLHPYDENHIIGFGKDAVAAEEDDTSRRNIDFAWYQGMKIALFDVSDPTNPKQLFTELIGDRGTQSQLLYDHKALLFDREKNLLAFPVQVAELPEKICDEPGPCEHEASAWGDTVFDGAYVYSLDLQDGFQLQGAISHYSEEDEAYLKQGSYWHGEYLKQIKRILYIGQNLYTVAEGGIKATDMNTIEEKNYLELQPSFKYDDEIYEEPGGIIERILP